MKFSGPRILLQVEGGLALTAACALYQHIGASWWWFAALFFVPDLSALGYFAGKKAGAYAYNSAHTYLAPALLWSVAYFAHRPAFLPFCLIWVAHIGFDRLLGYGFKYTAAFKETHFSRL